MFCTFSTTNQCHFILVLIANYLGNGFPEKGKTLFLKYQHYFLNEYQTCLYLIQLSSEREYKHNQK